MRFLPRYFTSVVVFFLFVFFLSSGKAQAVAANPQDIFNPSLVDLVREKEQIRKQAAADPEGITIIYDGDVGRRETIRKFGDLAMLGFPLCIEDCENMLSTNTPTASQYIIKIMAVMYSHPPASGIAYVYDTLANAGIVKPAYAQGIGFAALTPFLPIWKVTRNIAYTLIIIVMVVIGFMVIFQMKIDPKTVISVQAAIPKIVLSLILITLSYPIVGFLVDIMYLVMAIGVGILADGAGGQIGGWDTKSLQSSFATADIGTLFSTIFWGGLKTFDDFIRSFAISAVALPSLVGGALALLPIAIGFWALAGPVIIPIIFIVILFFGLLFVFIRLLMILANSYIQLVISLILAPILLLNEAIPGRSGFKNWILNVIANLSVFPTTAIILLFATYLTSSGIGGKWSPPFLGLGFAETGYPGFFAAFMGMSMIFISPNLVVAVKKIFQPKPTLPITAGTALSPLTGGIQTAMGATSQFYYGQMALGSLKGIIPGLGGGRGRDGGQQSQGG